MGALSDVQIFTFLYTFSFFDPAPKLCMYVIKLYLLDVLYKG